MSECAFPACPETARAQATTCDLHEHVTLSASGSWVNDGHLEGGHG